jgi:hypothetical protein
MTSGD